MNAKHLLASLVISFSFASAYAAEEPGEMINRATCTSGKESRELEIVSKGNGHSVTYTKGKDSKEVGSCSSNLEKCQVVFDNIKANLEKSGYTCK